VDPPRFGMGNGRRPAGRRKGTGKRSTDPPAIRPNFDCAPTFIDKVEIHVARNAPQRARELSAQDRQRASSRSSADLMASAASAISLVVVATAQPTPKALAADWPSFPLPTDRKIGNAVSVTV
jgi:hypothetical protein